MPGVYKELAIEFILNNDGSISTKIKPSDTEYSINDIYMVYRYLYQLLNDLKFDWSKEGEIQVKTIIKNKEESK